MKTYPIGYFHVDLAEVRTEQGKLYLFVAIDRTSKFAFVELHETATRRIAGDFLRHLIAAELARAPEGGRRLIASAILRDADRPIRASDSMA